MNNEKEMTTSLHSDLNYNTVCYFKLKFSYYNLNLIW